LIATLRRSRPSVIRRVLPHLSVLALLMGAWLWPLLAAAAASPRNVLVIYSDDRLLPANLEADRAMRETITNTAEHPVELYAEFLDRTHFNGEAYDRAVAGYLREKYSAHPPDVIIACARYALDLVLRNRAALFPRAPVVFAGVSPSWLRSLGSLPDDVVGVPVQYDYAGTIDQALRFHPNASRVVIVTGASQTDRDDETRLRNETARLSRSVSVEFLAGLPTAEVIERVAALGPSTIVFTAGYFADGDGRVFSPRESAQIIAHASTAPVYGPFNTFIGTGVVGGRMPNFGAMGRQAGIIVNSLFEGAAPASLTSQASTPTGLQLDWRQVVRWGIQENLIPPDAVVHFKEPTFWQAYGRAALIATLVILLQAALIAGLLYERRLQRRTAAALEVSERSMTLAARTARVSNWVWRVAPDMEAANGTSRRRASAERDPVLKEPIVEFDEVLATTHPSDREALARAVNDAVVNDRELDVEYRVVQPNQVRWIAARGRAEHGSGQRLRGVALDITQRKTAELQAEQDRNALRHMTRVSLLGQMSASIAHQLNQPLAAILGNAEAARTMLGRDNVDLDELRAICDDIVTEDNRAAEVIRRLSALFKGGVRELRPVDMNELIRETRELLRTDLVTRQVVTEMHLTAGLPPVNGERVQLQQVLLNLIVNAADAMSGVDESCRVLTISSEAVGTDVRVCVSDHGPGIAAKDLDTIFDPFWSTKRGGMGIGLAVCRSITAAHGGSLTVINNTDGGAKFCVTLPTQAQA
jgi:C4-dicarboxylate-specific signal transduction histidine kinase